MSNTYEYATMNQSPTITVEVGVNLDDARGKAVKFDAGKVSYPAIGEIPVGLVLLSESEDVKKDDELTIQVKDIGKWIAGGIIVAGDLLTSDADGLCQKATTGQYAFARALSGATTKNDIVNVQIINAGYLK